MRILYGLDRPDDGTVVIDDEPVRLSGPADATRRRIGMVHQEFKLVDELTLLENLVLGREPVRRGRLDWARARTEAEALAGETGVRIEWDRPAGRAGGGGRGAPPRRRGPEGRSPAPGDPPPPPPGRRRADPRRADGRARPAPGRGAAPPPPPPAGRRPHDRLHLPQAAGGARRRR